LTLLLETSAETVVVFDLDDTIFSELDYVHSGLAAVAAHLETAVGFSVLPELLANFVPGRDLFGGLCDTYDLPRETTESLLAVYRGHNPTLKMRPGVSGLLQDLQRSHVRLGLLTDGRSTTQRQKLQALGLDEFFDEVVISEEFGSSKPAIENYVHFETRFPGCAYWYIADNYAKDFVSPNELGWGTVGVLDPGLNIHSQEPTAVAEEFLPKYEVDSLEHLRFQVLDRL